MLTVGNSNFPPHLGHIPLAAATSGGLPLPMVSLPMLPVPSIVPSSTADNFRGADSLNFVMMPRVKNNSGSGSTSSGNGYHADTGNGSIRSTPSPDLSQNKLFVGGLSWQTSAEKLREYFGQFGTVLDVQILKDPGTNRSRGFGFITFSDATSVERVLQLPSHTLDGKRIDPKHATPKGKSKNPAASTSSRTKKVFVGGVSQDTSVEEVKAYFSHFGRVEEAVMLMDQQTKRHRGFGFVTFESEDVVDRICDIHYHTIKAKKVECKKAQSKEVIAQSNAVALAAAKRGAGALLGLPIGLPPVSTLPPVVNPLAAQQLVAAQGFGKLMSVPTLTNYRFSPYAVPSNAAQVAASVGATPASPYQGYNLTNVDMSGFQGVDWNAIYGVGMYV